MHLLHVQQKGHCPKGTGGSGATPALTPYGSAGGMSLLGSGPLPSLGLATLRSAPLFSAPPATLQEHGGPGSYERTAVLPPGPPMSPRYSLPPVGGFGLGSPAGGSTDMGFWGSGSGFQTAPSGYLGSPLAPGQPGQEACEQLLERCRLQLLGESRRCARGRLLGGRRGTVCGDGKHCTSLMKGSHVGAAQRSGQQKQHLPRVSRCPAGCAPTAWKFACCP